MNDFIELTNLHHNRKMFISSFYISGVVQTDRCSKVYIAGDMVPFEVMEKAEYIMMLLNSRSK